ncbi:MAG TPA: helix-turn-helix domain-containing protein [Thermoleophilia bacterium]|nr:helix-turn-helix domain-containing protein [Thermoleophilia bacterium]
MHEGSYRERDYGFGRRILGLRSEADLTQSALAELLGISRNAVVAWEGGATHPSAPHLRHLIELCMARGAFHEGQEAAEIRELWEDSQLRVPLDEAWLARLLESDSSTPIAHPVGEEASPKADRQLDWGSAPEASEFFGRAAELSLLGRWLLTDGCRVVSLLGMGGIGKTALAARLARHVASHFELVYWRSLRDAPPAGEWLAGAIDILSGHQIVPPTGDSERLASLLQLLRDRRCLLVLDNFETLLEPGREQGVYRPGMAGYGRLLEAVAGARHDSCLLLTSREAPPELALLGTTLGSLTLGGLGIQEAEAMLAPKQLDGSSEQWAELVARFGGNGLALKLVGERIRELFDSSIGLYLEETEARTVFGGIRQLITEQVERGTTAEKRVLRVLAVAREPLPLADLLRSLAPGLGREAVLEAVESVYRRSLLERVDTAAGVAFTLQSVVLEYETDRLVEMVAEEIESIQPARLVEQALFQPQSRDYIRQAQDRLIGLAILERLQGRLGREATERRLLELLNGWRDRPAEDQGHGPGKVINLLRLLRGDLRGLDLSRLEIRGAYLAGVDAQDASLMGAHLTDTVLAEAFDIPASVALSADGDLVAAGTVTGEIRVWRVADRTPLWTVQGHLGGIWCLALSGDGQVVASGGFGGTVKLWEAASGRPLARLEGHAGVVWGIALSADGRLAASGGADGTVRLWDAVSGRPLATLEGHDGFVWSVALSADGRLAASGGADGTVRLWDARNGRALATIEGHTGGVRGVTLSADGRLVASGGFDANVRLWEAGSGRALATLEGHAAAVSSVRLSAEGHLLVSGSLDGTARLWDADSGRPLATFQGLSGGVRAVALSGDGSLVASGSYDGIVRLWDAGSAQPLVTFQGQTAGVWAVALSAADQLVASGGADGIVRLWEAETERLLIAVKDHADGVSGVALSADSRLLASGGFDGTVRLRETGSGELLATLQGHRGEVSSVALSADGHLLASGGDDGTVRLWGADGGAPLATMEGHTGVVWGVALSADGRLLASGGTDGTVRLWDAASGCHLATLDGHVGVVWDVALSADGRLAASGGADGTVRLWDTERPGLLTTLEGHTAEVVGVALSADGRLLASGDMGGTVRLWDAESSRLLKTLEGHTGMVWNVAVSPDGRLAASGSGDGTVRLWQTEDGACLCVLRPERPYEGMDISGLTGVNEAQRQTLLALGAVQDDETPTS